MQGLKGYSGGAGCDYELDLESALDDTRPEDLELDEIPPSLIGQCRLSALTKHTEDDAIVFMMRAILLLTSLPFFTQLVMPPDFTSGPPTHVRWARHVGQLICCGLFVAVPVAREIKAFASYFGIAKADMKGCRTIFNGKIFSERCARPPTTNLPDITDVLRALSDMCHQSGPFSCITGDVRHMFHQLPLDEQISNYFGLKFKEADWADVKSFANDKLPADWNGLLRLRSLPMGFAFSPWAAQSIGFGMLIIALERAGVSDLGLWKSLQNPPPMIKLFDEKGKMFLLAVLWYDNLLVATTNHALSLAIEKQIRVTFNDDFKLQLKELERFDSNALKRNSPRHPSYLNLEFRTSMKRGRDGRRLFTLEWCPLQKKRDKWIACTALISPSIACRTLAKIVGTILWAHHIRLTPLCRLQRLINLVRRSASRAAEHSSWDAAVSLAPDEIGFLTQAVADAGQEVWSSAPCPDDHLPIYVATDSSGWRWAYVVWPERRGTQDASLSDASDWGATMTNASIFLKELLCLTLAVERLCAQCQQRKIVAFVDNTAACHVARRLASSTHGGSELAVRIADALQRSSCTLEVIHIASQQNPADTPTRSYKRDLCDERVASMWRCLEEHDAGRILEVSMDEHKRSMSSGLRHEERDDAYSRHEESEDDAGPEDDFTFEVFLGSDDE